MKKLLFIAMITLLLSACASQEEIASMNSASVAIVQAQTQMKRPPLLSIKCINGECRGMEVTYTPEAPAIAVPRVRSTNDTIVEIAPSVTNMFSWAVGAIAVTRIVDDIAANAGDGNITTHNTNTISGDDNNTAATSTIDRTGPVSDSHAMSNSYNPTDSHAITDSQNPTDSHDATATPTVVNAQVVSPVIVP